LTGGLFSGTILAFIPAPLREEVFRMRRFFAPFLVLVVASPAWISAVAAPAPTCSAAYPHGIQGTFHTLGDAVTNAPAAGYQLTEDYTTWQTQTIQQWRQMLDAKAATGPLKFTWATGLKNDPAQLFLVIELFGSGRDANGNATAYWGVVMVQRAGLAGDLFLYTTHSYVPQAGWQDQMLQEAVDGTYSDLANGWTCAKP